VRHAASAPESRNPDPAVRGVDVSLFARRGNETAFLLPLHVTLYVTTMLAAQAGVVICLNLPSPRSNDKDRAYGLFQQC
jgi:hypothetical protein